MKEDRIWILFARRVSGGITPEELKELEVLIREQPDHGYSMDIILRFFESDQRTGQPVAIDTARGLWPRLEAAMHKTENPKITHSNAPFMLMNYLKIALRNLRRQKGFAFINVFGLAVGIACFSLLFLFVANERSFDQFHHNAANIYRLYVTWDPSLFGVRDERVYTDYGGSSGQPIGDAMKQNLPDVENVVKLRLPWGENLVRAENKIIRAPVGFADGSLFSVFDFPLKYGTKASALKGINDIVLTESKAKLLFGSSEHAVGRAIDIQFGIKYFPFTVSAVANDPPPNSTIRFDVLASYSFARSQREDVFYIGSNRHPTIDQTYVLLKPGSKLAERPEVLDRFLRGYSPMSSFKDMGIDWKKDKMPATLKLQPLRSIHTASWFHGYEFTDYEKIDPATIWILLGIAGGILLIACINFTTLAVGRSASRSKEVGLRKVVGAEKKQIVFQFLSEAVMLSILSALLGLWLAFLALPWFNQLAGRDLHFSFGEFPLELLLIGIVALAAGILAGSYPALVLARFKPVEVLKSKIRLGGSNLFTKSLVTFQFSLSISLIICTIIILQQTSYMINKSPGFDKENVVAIDAGQTDPGKLFPLFKQALLNRPEIIGVTSAAAGMGAGKGLLGYSDQGFSADVNIIDTGYVRVLGMHLLAGNNLEPAMISDSSKPILINETTMRSLGWEVGNAVGKTIKGFQGGNAIVTGVVQNFNYRPLGEPVRNQVFITSTDKGFVNFYVRLRPGNPSQSLRLIERTWNSLAPGVPLKYSFLDEDINGYYLSEKNWSRIVAWGGGISVFLACLGLLGLAALAAANRTKEIGIRKVLGASEAGVVLLVAKDFVLLVGVAFLIAAPVAWMLMHRWLADYANRIGISWMVFVAVGLLTALLAMAAIGHQTIRAAMTNPVKALRAE
jgi:putative ABC transport system permease protein